MPLRMQPYEYKQEGFGRWRVLPRIWAEGVVGGTRGMGALCDRPTTKGLSRRRMRVGAAAALTCEGLVRYSRWEAGGWRCG